MQKKFNWLWIEINCYDELFSVTADRHVSLTSFDELKDRIMSGRSGGPLKLILSNWIISVRALAVVILQTDRLSQVGSLTMNKNWNHDKTQIVRMTNALCRQKSLCIHPSDMNPTNTSNRRIHGCDSRWQDRWKLYRGLRVDIDDTQICAWLDDRRTCSITLENENPADMYHRRWVIRSASSLERFWRWHGDGAQRDRRRECHIRNPSYETSVWRIT